MIKGKKVNLRAIKREDIEQLRRWRNLPEVLSMVREYRQIGEIHQERWFESLTDDRDQVLFSILRGADGSLLGVTGLTYINWVYRHGEISIIINPDESNKGYGTEALQMTLRHGFQTLNLHMICGEIYEFNITNRHVFEKVGFHEDGKLRHNYYWNGKYYDSIFYSILQEEWLGLREVEERKKKGSKR